MAAKKPSASSATTPSVAMSDSAPTSRRTSAPAAMKPMPSTSIVRVANGERTPHTSLRPVACRLGAGSLDGQGPLHLRRVDAADEVVGARLRDRELDGRALAGGEQFRLHRLAGGVLHALDRDVVQRLAGVAQRQARLLVGGGVKRRQRELVV